MKNTLSNTTELSVAALPDDAGRALSVNFSSHPPRWTTPQWLFDAIDKEFGFTLDLCSTHGNAKCNKHFTRDENGLLKSWSHEVVFMNPPYGDEIATWMSKAHDATTREESRHIEFGFHCGIVGAIIGNVIFRVGCHRRILLVRGYGPGYGSGYGPGFGWSVSAGHLFLGGFPDVGALDLLRSGMLQIDQDGNDDRHHEHEDSHHP